MRRRPVLSVAMASAIAVSGIAVGVVSTAGVSQARPAPLIYMSLGDSYSVGYQPGLGATAGYTAVVAKKEKMTLANFGCGGATTSSIMNAIGCTESGYGPVASVGAVPYPTTTQAQAALDFIAANPGKIGLVTVSIGGNDVTGCATSGGTISAITACVSAADASITTNVTALVSSLDAALAANNDTTARVIGLTYPDVILGAYVYPTFPASASSQSLAAASILAFDVLINPTLSAAYGASNFVNVTAAPYKVASAGLNSNGPSLTTGAFKKLVPYGKIPAAVWEVCTLTYFCSQGNIHANDAGYNFIGKLIVSYLKAGSGS